MPRAFNWAMRRGCVGRLLMGWGVYGVGGGVEDIFHFIGVGSLGVNVDGGGAGSGVVMIGVDVLTDLVGALGVVEEVDNGVAEVLVLETVTDGANALVVDEGGFVGFGFVTVVIEAGIDEDRGGGGIKFQGRNVVLGEGLGEFVQEGLVDEDTDDIASGGVHIDDPFGVDTEDGEHTTDLAGREATRSVDVDEGVTLRACRSLKISCCPGNHFGSGVA